MGLFSSSSKTYVSTVTYPMGSDDPDDRVDFNKYVVLNSILQDRSVGDTLPRSLLASRGMKLRSVYAYARDHYFYGVPYSGTLSIAAPNQEEIRSVLKTLYTPADVYVLTSVVGLTDFTYWAEEYLAKTYGYDRLLGLLLAPPPGVEQDATISYDIDKAGIIQILLINADGQSYLIQYKPTTMQSQRLYLHTIYRLITEFPTQTTTESHPTIEGESSYVSTTLSIVDTLGKTQEKTTVVTVTVENGTTTTVTTETVRSLSRPQYFFYQIGAGDFPTFDAWMESTELDSPYYPSIPLRIDNKDVSTTDAAKRTDLYKTSKKLLKKIEVDFDEVAEKINKNTQVSEIDFAYIQFGVALNSKVPECKRYIYRFMEYLMDLSYHSRAETDAWIQTHAVTMQAMQAEGTVNSDGSGGGGGGSVGFVSPPLNKLAIYDRESRSKKGTLDLEIQWQYIEKTVKNGVIKTGAKPGDCTVGTEGTRQEYHVMYDFTVDNSTLVVKQQLTENTYEELRIGGLVFYNHVYKDKVVAISAWDAFHPKEGESDPDEGFILPLSQDILRQMSILEVTQLSADCLFLVLNCYQVVKKKWYQTGFFAVLMTIVAAVLLVLTWGGSATISASMIGSAIGWTASTLGVSTLIATYIVATMTVLASMIMMKLLSPVLVDVFGETWGRVLAVVVAMVAMNYVSTGSLLGNTTQFTQVTAKTLIQNSMATVNLYSKYLEGQMANLDLPGQMQAMTDEHKARMEEIERLTRENLGTNADIIDIQGFLETTALVLESPDSFLTRTLMTGNDIAEITRGMIEDFAEFGLYLPTHP